jgi:hypothetical protein
LFREIRDRGYTGSLAVVLAYLRPLRAAGRAPEPAPAAPEVRTVTRRILTHSDRLYTDDTAALNRILERSPQLATTAAHVAAFAQMLYERHDDRLDAWIHRGRGRRPTRPTPLHPRTAPRAVTPSSPASPNPTAPASSKATSTASKRSNGRCSAAPTSTYSANASSSSGDPQQGKKDHKISVRSTGHARSQIALFRDWPMRTRQRLESVEIDGNRWVAAA